MCNVLWHVLGQLKGTMLEIFAASLHFKALIHLHQDILAVQKFRMFLETVAEDRSRDPLAGALFQPDISPPITSDACGESLSHWALGTLALYYTEHSPTRHSHPACLMQSIPQAKSLSPPTFHLHVTATLLSFQTTHNDLGVLDIRGMQTIQNVCSQTQSVLFSADFIGLTFGWESNYYQVFLWYMCWTSIKYVVLWDHNVTQADSFNMANLASFFFNYSPLTFQYVCVPFSSLLQPFPFSLVSLVFHHLQMPPPYTFLSAQFHSLATKDGPWSWYFVGLCSSVVHLSSGTDIHLAGIQKLTSLIEYYLMHQ